MVESTCTTNGYTLYTCTCGDSYQAGSGGHTFTTLVVEPTETVNGFTLHECACGYSYQSDPVASLGAADDSDGPSTSDVKVYDYVYNGSSLTQLVITTTVYTESPVTETLYFAYDGSSPMSVTYNGDTFYYVTNLQGDVIAILNDQGAAVVTYSYDAWGNILEIGGSKKDTLGVANPLTYRSYVYDTESSLYYLQSRYYNPEVGRFINADAFASTGQGFIGNNMFAYCLNSPITYCDPSGDLAYPGEIHNEVVRRLENEYQLNSEQTILYRVRWGRADLISDSGEVWDVKRDKPSQIAAGKKQVKKYVANTWRAKPDQKLSVGGQLFTGTKGFFYTSGSVTYRVTYRCAGDGVIAYDYFVVDIDTQPATQALVIALVACIGGYIISRTRSAPTANIDKRG